MGTASLVAQTVNHLLTMQETRVGSLGLEDSLEREMATHSSILAWKIPWMEEPGRPQSTGRKNMWGFPGGSDSKETACNSGDPGSIPGSGRSPWRRECYPLQYSCWENSTDRGPWRATVHGVTKNRYD